MSKRDEFVEFVEILLEESHRPCPENVRAYLDAIKGNEDTGEKPMFTDNGKAILRYLQGAPEGMYKAKDIAEGMFIASKSVSGAMRKLCTDGFVEKVGKDPVVYTITEKGKNVQFEEDNV